MTKILVIDDEESVRTLLRLMLEREGYDVITAADGVQGLRAFTAEGADLVITDLVMPDKEGFETIKDIKNIYPETPVIVISGGGLIDAETYLKLAGKLGAARTFSKPLDRKKLVEAVKQLTA